MNEQTSTLPKNGTNLLGRRAALALGIASGLAAWSGIAPAAPPDKKEDAANLNILLKLELRLIAAYDVCFKSDMLGGQVLAIAQQFHGHHQTHRDLLAKAIAELGGKVDPPPARFEFNTSALVSGREIITFALGFETGITTAYLEFLAGISTVTLYPLIGGLAAAEAQHAALWRMALGQPPVPEPIVR